MLRKTITYTDFNGEEAREDFYFNMTRAELVELEFSMEGGFSETMKRMIETDPEGKVNGKIIMEEMKKLLLKSYGVKSPDGKRFVKNDRLRQDFESSEAYSVLFMDLVTDADAAATFINGIMPANLVEEIAKMPEAEKLSLVQTPMGGVRPPEESLPEKRKVTRAELTGMDQAEFQRVSAQIQNGEVLLAE
jgi:hypothetical protein